MEGRMVGKPTRGSRQLNNVYEKDGYEVLKSTADIKRKKERKCQTPAGKPCLL